MSLDPDAEGLKVLDSLRTSFETLNSNLSEALRRIDEATSRISALAEINIKLARTIMGVLNIPIEGDLPSTLLPIPVGAIYSTERADLMASGLLRPITMSLRRPCGDIAEVMDKAKKEIVKATPNFQTYEMDIMLRELRKDPNRTLAADEQTSFRNKIREWSSRLKDSFLEFEE